MTSALTTAALATSGVVAYYPMEEAGGATTAADAGSNTLSALALTGAGAASHVLPGQAAMVPGAGGSWSCDGTTGVYLQRTVGSSDAMRLASAWTLAGWVYPTAVPTGTVDPIFGRSNNWRMRLQTSTQGGTYSAATNYAPGQIETTAGVSYVCLAANGPATTVVTPGTNAGVWEPIVFVATFGKFTTLVNVQQNYTNPIPLNKPSFLAMTWDGFECAIWLNGVKEFGRYTQSQVASPAWDTMTQTTDAFQVFGGSGLPLTGNIWGLGVWNIALDRGAQRSIYLAGIGAGNEIATTFKTIDTVRDAATPPIAGSGAVAYYCAGCGGGMRAAEGYLTVASQRYHHGCYASQRTAVTPSLLGNASVLADLADRSARVGRSMLLTAARREHVEKRFYHDGTYLQPYQSPANSPSGADWRSWAQGLGGFAALLSRYSRASRESWLTLLASNQMEFLVASMMGAPAAWLAAGWASIAQAPVTGANSFGSIQPAFDTASQGNNQGWMLRTMCITYLCLRRQAPAATLNRWEQAIVAAANNLVSGQSLATPASPVVPATNYATDVLAIKPAVTNQWYYVNGNFMLRDAVAFYLTYLVTGDQRWKTQHDWTLAYARYPYGQPLSWLGNWAAATSYSTTGDAINGPHAVRNAGSAYKCILSIAGSAGNPVPGSDPTHWQVIDSGNNANRQGYGLIVETQGSDAAYWSDYVVHLNEYGSGAGGGAPGTVLAGQPGYDGDYATVQTDEAALGYLLTGNPTYRQMANALMNKTGLYPVGGTNPQSTWFSLAGTFAAPGVNGGSGNLWAVDKTSGVNGGYSTRHSFTDGYRAPWLPISQLAGYRSDLTAGFGVAMFVTQVESQFKIAANPSNYNSGLWDQMLSVFGSLLMAAPAWPGFAS